MNLTPEIKELLKRVRDKHPQLRQVPDRELVALMRALLYYFYRR